MNALTQTLSTAIDGEVCQLLQRWPVFADKVSARIDDALEEADGGLDAMLAEHVSDAQAMSTAFGAVQARIEGLTRKLNEASDRIAETLLELLCQGEIPQSDRDALDAARDSVLAQRDRLVGRFESRFAELQLRKSAQWARALELLSRREMQTPPRCRECGGTLTRQVYWQTENVTCKFCDAVNSCAPGPATALYFGSGVHWLAQEAAWRRRCRAAAARARLVAARYPSPEQRAAWLSAEQAYWTAYYEHHAQLHPGFASSYGTVAAAVEAKLAHHIE